jgi:hypothetical protein
MSLLTELAPLVSQLDPRSGAAWLQAVADVHHERRIKARALLFLLYVPAFVALFEQAVWRSEARRRDVGAWGRAAMHTLAVWVRILAVAGGVGIAVAVFVTGAYGSLGGALLGAAYVVTLGSMGVAGRVHPFFSRRRHATLLPLPDRLRAAALVALLMPIVLGLLLPLAFRHVSGVSSAAGQASDRAGWTLIDHARLLVEATLQADLAMALMHLSLLTLLPMLSVVALVAPLSARGFERRHVGDAWRTDVVVATLTMAALVLVAATSMARTPAGSLLALVLQGALITVAVLTAVRGLLVEARSTGEAPT